MVTTGILKAHQLLASIRTTGFMSLALSTCHIPHKSKCTLFKRTISHASFIFLNPMTSQLWEFQTNDRYLQEETSWPNTFQGSITWCSYNVVKEVLFMMTRVRHLLTVCVSGQVVSRCHFTHGALFHDSGDSKSHAWHSPTLKDVASWLDLDSIISRGGIVAFQIYYSSRHSDILVDSQDF